jgi:DNA-binding transcriptional ArsR family regulator
MQTGVPARSRPVHADFRRMARVLSVVADERRLRMLSALSRKELCVCELVDILMLRQYEVSRHLARLKQVGLVVARKEGLWAYYSVPPTAWQDSLLSGFLAYLEQATKGLDPGKRDAARLKKRLAMRDAGRCVVGFQY